MPRPPLAALLITAYPAWAQGRETLEACGLDAGSCRAATMPSDTAKLR
ncbi:MAG TPA: hypothetical protein VGC80_18175 [Acetobacteraceae bacterium]|jgi:hypothetical protein